MVILGWLKSVISLENIASAPIAPRSVFSQTFRRNSLHSDRQALHWTDTELVLSRYEVKQ